MNFNWTQGELADGLKRYNAGEFFEAHEAWEIVWLGSPEPEKTFLQGLIQVAAAAHHLHRNNRQGAVQLLRAALRRLENYPESFGNISLPMLRHDIQDLLQALEAAKPSSQLVPVRIQPC